MWPQRGIVHITNPRKASGSCRSGYARMFTFDSVYDWNTKQDELYENTVKPLVYSVLDGYNGTIFAYGQTGTGKTYTMLGSQEPVSQGQSQASREKGIASKCFEDIFRHIAYTREATSYVVRASYFEIYQEETRDLLSPDGGQRPLLLGEDVVRGVYVKGLRSVVCKNIKAIERVMGMGNINRATAATNMNEHSSRSHAIFQVSIEMLDPSARPSGRRRVGKLNLVDLAGSERQCKTGAVGKRLKESGKINLSLSALGNVISALTATEGGNGNRHIPYRDSKLTQLLQDSLGGNSKAIMIANIGPASYNYDESLMTLRYASRAKHIKNRPTRNVNSMAVSSIRTRSQGPRRGPRSAISLYKDEMCALNDLMRGGSGVTAMTAKTTKTLDDSSSSSGNRRRRLYHRTHSAASACSSRPRPNRRSHCRVVWKLGGKYHQETTVKMVRWIQEQMDSGWGPGGDRCEQNIKDKTWTPVKEKESLVESERAMQHLVGELSEDLANAASKEKIQTSTQNDHQTATTSAFLRLATDLNEICQLVETDFQKQHRELLSEQSRLQKVLALKSAIFRAYVSERKVATDIPKVIEVGHVDSLSDSCLIPTLVS